jgi:transcriptional regulator with XRE-family HTH domain
LTQQRLAERAGLDQRQLSKIETDRRGCNPSAARRLAGELGVDVAELRAHPREQDTRAAKPRVSRLNLHRAYLGVLLGREVGSAYTALSEEALEKHCEGLSWEGVVEVASGRRREAQVLRELLGGTALPEEVRPRRSSAPTPTGTSASWRQPAAGRAPRKAVRDSPRPCESSCDLGGATPLSARRPRVAPRVGAVGNP